MKIKSYSKNIFTLNTINKAIYAYKNICKIYMFNIFNKYICIFKDSKYSLDQTIKEFGNYLIDIQGKNND